MAKKNKNKKLKKLKGKELTYIITEYIKVPRIVVYIKFI